MTRLIMPTTTEYIISQKSRRRIWHEELQCSAQPVVDNVALSRGSSQWGGVTDNGVGLLSRAQSKWNRISVQPFLLSKSPQWDRQAMKCNLFLNIPILPIGILDFCKQKLLARPMVPVYF